MGLCGFARVPYMYCHICTRAWLSPNPVTSAPGLRSRLAAGTALRVTACSPRHVTMRQGPGNGQQTDELHSHHQANQTAALGSRTVQSLALWPALPCTAGQRHRATTPWDVMLVSDSDGDYEHTSARAARVQYSGPRHRADGTPPLAEQPTSARQQISPPAATQATQEWAVSVDCIARGVAQFQVSGGLSCADTVCVGLAVPAGPLYRPNHGSAHPSILGRYSGTAGPVPGSQARWRVELLHPMNPPSPLSSRSLSHPM